MAMTQPPPHTLKRGGGSRIDQHDVRDKHRGERKRGGTGLGTPCLHEVLKTGQSPCPISVLTAADRSCSAAMIPRSDVTEPYMPPPTLCDEGTDVISRASSSRPLFIYLKEGRVGGGGDC